MAVVAREGDEALFYVYQISFDRHDRVYIGYTSTSIEKRFYYHWKCRNRLNTPLAKCLRRVSKDDVKIEILYTSWDKEDALQAEISLIKQRSSLITECGLNMTVGGENPPIGWNGRQWMEGKSDDEIAAINKKKGLRGDENPFYGKSHDEEVLSGMVATRRRNGTYNSNTSAHLNSGEAKEKATEAKREATAIRAGFRSDIDFVHAIADVYQEKAGSCRWIAATLGSNHRTVGNRISLMKSGEYGEDLKKYIDDCDKYTEEDKTKVQIMGRFEFEMNFKYRIPKENVLCLL